MQIKILPSLATVGIIAVAFFTGCTSAGTSSGDASLPGAGGSNEKAGETDVLDMLIEDGLANAKSDFQREVIAEAKKSGVISEADWKEANNRYVECLTLKGHKVELIYEGTKVLTVEETSERESEQERQRRRRSDHECYEKTSAFINDIYTHLNGGPGSEKSGDEVLRAVFACLIDRELVPKDTTFDQFAADLQTNEGKAFGGEGEPNDEAFANCWKENT